MQRCLSKAVTVMIRALLGACFFWGFIHTATAANDVEQVDSLVSARLDNGLEQQGVLTMVKGDAPSMLVLLFPGEPSVLKAEIVESKLMKTRVGGNPLVRARSLLVRPGVGTVLIDCRSDQEEQCKESYVMSKDRFEDVRKLTSQLRQALPGVKKIWLVGHSFGSLASASLARYGDGVFDGAIHVSTILSGKASYRSLVGFDFSVARVPQLFIHHRHDPCPGTPFSAVESAAARYKVALVAISDANATQGAACGPFSEHGFAGAERVLMQTISDAVEHGVNRR
jgi:alpha/beta superfamily hydrolase